MNFAWIGMAAVLTGVTVADAEPLSFKPGETGVVVFGTPSGNMSCSYVPAGGTEIYKPAGGRPELWCDRAEPTYVRVRLERRGPARRENNPGDPDFAAWTTSWPMVPRGLQVRSRAQAPPRD